jgi:hypothetical protein
MVGAKQGYLQKQKCLQCNVVLFPNCKYPQSKSKLRINGLNFKIPLVAHNLFCLECWLKMSNRFNAEVTHMWLLRYAKVNA